MTKRPRPLDPNTMTRSPGLTYQQLLDADTHPVPPVLRLQSPMDLGNEDISIDRYISRAWFDKEVEYLWKRAWQYACREEEIPEAGDYYKYDIVGMSFLVVRTPSGDVRAFPNACLHRGRMLKEYDGRASELRCPFHGFCWDLDGKLKDIPARWDFEYVEDDKFGLPSLPVGRWGGFIFINPDRDCEPFEDFISDVRSHFERWKPEALFISSYTAKVVAANWKILQEAFCEAYHVNATHPQILMSLADTNTQVDVWRNCGRTLTAGGAFSPLLLDNPPTQEQLLRSALDLREGDEVPAIPAGMSVRAFLAERMRAMLRPLAGKRVDEYCDAEILDSIVYSVFPNFHPWGAFNAIVYRFRPNGNDHRSAIMECIILMPFEGKRPPPAKMQWVAQDESWSTRIPFLGRVFDQDLFNVPKVQLGLESTYKPGVSLASYQESKVRFLQHRLGEFVEEGEKQERTRKERAR